MQLTRIEEREVRERRKWKTTVRAGGVQHFTMLRQPNGDIVTLPVDFNQFFAKLLVDSPS